MNIPKAIRTIEEGINSGHGCAVPNFNDACKLGIEALKDFKYHRDLNIISFVELLPGETKD